MHHVPDALSRVYEEEREISVNAIVGVGEDTRDEWYRKRYEEVLTDPEKFAHWRVVDGQLYYLRLKPIVSEILWDRYHEVRQGFNTCWLCRIYLRNGVECRVLRKANGLKIREALEELIVSRWGTPKILLTDNGTEFINKINLKEFTEKNQITHTTVLPYYLQANPVERVNRVLKAMIVAFVEKDHREWDLHLADFRFAYNTAYHTSLGTSPAILNLGRELVPPNLLRHCDEDVTDLTVRDPAEWSQRMRDLQAIREWVTENLDKANQEQTRRYNLRL